jgi:hypothetical protein
MWTLFSEWIEVEQKIIGTFPLARCGSNNKELNTPLRARHSLRCKSRMLLVELRLLRRRESEILDSISKPTTQTAMQSGISNLARISSIASSFFGSDSFSAIKERRRSSFLP